MRNQTFLYPPSPQILQWLAVGQLTNRFQRALRFWVLLHQFYGSDFNWRENLPQPFTYSDLRKYLFASTHLKNDQLSAEALIASCSDPACICQKRFRDWVFALENQSESEWCQTVMQMTGLNTEDLKEQLEKRPFAIVHRSIRDDLKQLKDQGWLKSHVSGKYEFLSSKQWPSPPSDVSATISFAQLSASQTWELLRVLDAVAFVEPNLAIAAQSLSGQLTEYPAASHRLNTEPLQRIFIELDYILSDETQDRVDNYQAQLNFLWHQHEGGVVRFEYWRASKQQKVSVTAYPVCLHYVRRAKYLSAFGFDPDKRWGWHNYRLDRIASEQLEILAWGDPDIPKQLKQLWRTGQLPLPTDVKAYLDDAWGFNFYLPRALLLMRFPRKFAHWYVDNTKRHDTFELVNYHQLPQLILREIKNPTEQKQVLKIVENRSETDVYYQAWIRLGDINVLMRLRDWRPNGEVIAPLSVRKQLQEEALKELSNYQS